jgi:hypothetical protein
LFAAFPQLEGLVEGHVASFEARDDREEFVTCGLKTIGIHLFR